MKLLLFLSLLFLTSCATKYVVPGNRFITPESQGEALRGQFEFQQTNANQLTIDTSNATVDEGVLYSDISRSGFLLSNSLFDQFDLFWSHIGSANSMLGGKFQFIGGSRVSSAVGHKMSVGMAFGNNEHESEDESVEFELGGKEYLLLYGYRFSPNVLTYTSFSHATYHFSGDIRSTTPGLNGADPDFETVIQSFSGGLELTYLAAFGKLELTYQQLKTTDTQEKTRIIFGYSIGMSW